MPRCTVVDRPVAAVARRDLAFVRDARAAAQLSRALATLGFRRVHAEAPDGPGLYVIGRHTADGRAPVYFRRGARAALAAALGPLLASHTGLVEEIDAAGRPVIAFQPRATASRPARRHPLLPRRALAPIGPGHRHAKHD